MIDYNKILYEINIKIKRVRVLNKSDKILAWYDQASA